MLSNILMLIYLNFFLFVCFLLFLFLLLLERIRSNKTDKEGRVTGQVHVQLYEARSADFLYRIIDIDFH